MPTVLLTGPYRFFLYANERNEPPHVHVARDDHRAKFWLNPVRLCDSEGFGSVENGKLRRLVTEHEHEFSRAWDEFFG